MSGTLQTHEGEQNYLFERSEKLSALHFLYNIEQIDGRGQAPQVARSAFSLDSTSTITAFVWHMDRVRVCQFFQCGRPLGPVQLRT